MEEEMKASKLRSEFLEILLSRISFSNSTISFKVSIFISFSLILFFKKKNKNKIVPLSVEIGKPVKHPIYQANIDPGYREAMESCPKENITDFKDRLDEESLYLVTEAGEQGRLPVLILSMKGSAQQRRPAIVFLHSSYKCKEWLRPLLEALVSAWKNGNTMPFIFDTVWDLLKLADYLVQREDIDPARIGITGESLGGMHAWFAAASDTRYAAVVPIIGVQGFRWALDNDKWQARVNSIKPVFEEASIDLGKAEIDKEVVEKVWDRIAPGLASQFDAPYTVPVIVPRPHLILNGAKDLRCPLAGLDVPIARSREAYKSAKCPEKFEFIAEQGIWHQMTVSMVKETNNWFDKFLK